MPLDSCPSEIRPAAILLALLTLVPGVAAADVPSPAEGEIPPTAVAIVNGEVITVEDLEKRLETLHGTVEPTQRAAANLDRLLFRVVNDVLIGQEARTLGLHEEPPVPETIERNRRRLAVGLLEREEIEGPSRPDDEEVADVFDERFRRASFHVLTAPDREGAEKILQSLRDGVDVAEVARELSIDPYREQGGLLESVARKDLQLAIASVVFAMAPNEVAGPVQTDLGWSVLVAREFAPPDPELFARERPSLVRLVRQRKEEAARQALLARLRERHTVEVDREVVDSIEPVRRPDGRLTAESPGPDKVVARVGDEIVLPADDYAVALERRWRTIPDEEVARAAAPIILEKMIGDLLLVAEAYDRGYHRLPAVERVLHGLETELIIPSYLNSVLAAGIEVSEEEKRAYYEKNKESLRRPPRVRLGQITVETREEAESIASALRGGSDLSWLAQRHSTDGLRDKGGVQDWMTVQPDGAPFNTMLLEATPGTTLDPVRREDSWVVYQVLARQEQGTFVYDEVSGNMRDGVFKKKFTEVLDRFIQTARSRSEIEVRGEVLAGLQLSGTQEEAAEVPGHGGHGGD